MPSKSLSTWERHVCCAPREEVSGPVMAPVINASTLSDKMPAHCTWEMLEARYAQLLEHQYTRRPLRLDVADGCADASAQQGSLPVRCMARDDDGVAARTTHKSRLSRYNVMQIHMLAECRRVVRDMQALKAERETLREQKKEDLPSNFFLPPLPTIEVAPGADVEVGLFRYRVAARTTHKSRLGSYHMLAECRRAVRDMQALKAERDTLREQKKEDLPSIFLPPLPTIEVAPGADVDLFCCFVPLPGMQSEHRSVSLASGAGEACLVAAQLGRISAGCHGRDEMEARLLGVCLYPLRR